jgi:hypothetical protein
VGGTDVGGDTDVLDNTSGGEDSGQIGQDRVKVELALRRDKLLAERSERILKNGGVGSLVELDGLELLNEEAGVGETGALHILGGELSDGLLVELGFELLENIGELCKSHDQLVLSRDVSGHVRKTNTSVSETSRRPKG